MRFRQIISENNDDKDSMQYHFRFENRSISFAISSIKRAIATNKHSQQVQRLLLARTLTLIYNDPEDANDRRNTATRGICSR